MENEPVKKRSTVGYWICIILLFIALGVSMFLNLGMGVALLATSPTTGSSDTAVDEFPQLEEEWSYGTGDVKVVRMQLSGVITRESEAGLFETPIDRIEELILMIRAARNDEEVKAIILEVDSPGGGITPSDELYTELMRFKESAEGRKVIVLMRDLAASGGYYVAMAGDWLIAQPTTVVGSIGVIMQTLNWKVLSDKIGVTDTTIKSGDNKDMLNPFRESNPEEIALLQKMIDAMHNRFRGIVATSRGLDAATLEDVTDGRIFTSDEALELKLIDQIGYWNDTVAKTAEVLGVDAIKVVRYYQTYSFWDFIAGIKHPLASPLARLNQGPSFQYLWKP
jgi:protease-4